MMDKAPKELPRFLFSAPLIAALGWLILCGICLVIVISLPKQFLAQLPTPISSITLPATTTPRPSRTASPIFSITPTQKSRPTKTPGPTSSLDGAIQLSPSATTTMLLSSNTPASLTAPPSMPSPGSQTPSATPQAAGINLLSMTSPIPVGGLASLSVQTTLGAVCQINFVSPSGRPVIIEGLNAIRTDAAGVCSWTWLIPLTMEVGQARITIQVPAGSETYVMDITAAGSTYP